MTTLNKLGATGVLVAGVVALLSSNGICATTNIYSTQFEPGEGFNPAFTLDSQGGWTGDGTGGNGLISGIIPGQGQHAYVGYFPPESTSEEQLLVWKPLNFDPIAAGLPIIKFSTQMRILDSENDEYDIFRWSIYNMQGTRLFTLDFDNYDYDTNGSKYVSYQLEGVNAPIVGTPRRFTNDVTYTLAVTMNFASNRWSATLNGQLITTNQLITTTAAPLNLGDVDAVWLLYLTNAPGDNFMVFDNYQITAESIPVATPPPAQVQLLGRTSEGWSLLRVLGQNNSRWSVDATTNLVNWTALKTNIISGGFFDQVDQAASGQLRRFYRARWVP